MDSKSLDPHGAALWAYFKGEFDAELIVRRDDGQEGRLPVSHFYRGPAEFTGLEKAAIDINPQAVTIMSGRGVTDTHCTDVFEHEGGPYQTLLMLGHGIGMVETLVGLDRFFECAHGLLIERGQIVLDSLDVTATADPENLAYLEANRRADRYVGETRVQFEYRGEAGPHCGWLHVDPAPLKTHATAAGWTCEVILKEERGDYLARLVKEKCST